MNKIKQNDKQIENHQIIKNILIALSKILKQIPFMGDNQTCITNSKEAELYLNQLTALHIKANNLNAFNPKYKAKKRGEIAKVRAIFETYKHPDKIASNLEKLGSEQKKAIIQHFTKGEGSSLFSKEQIQSFFPQQNVNNLNKWLALSITLTPHEIQKGVKKLPLSIQKAFLEALKQKGV